MVSSTVAVLPVPGTPDTYRHLPPLLPVYPNHPSVDHHAEGRLVYMHWRHQIMFGTSKFISMLSSNGKLHAAGSSIMAKVTFLSTHVMPSVMVKPERFSGQMIAQYSMQMAKSVEFLTLHACHHGIPAVSQSDDHKCLRVQSCGTHVPAVTDSSTKVVMAARSASLQGMLREVAVRASRA